MQRFRPLVKWISKHKIIFLVLIVLIIGGGYYYRRSRAKATQPQYQTAQVEKGTLVVSVSASGQVASTNSAPINTQASGVINKVFVENGQKVKAGEAILGLTLDQDSQQKYLQALSSFQSAKNSLDSANVNLLSLQSKMFAANQKFINDAVARDLATDDPTYIQENADWLAAEATYNNQQNVINQAQTALGAAGLSLRADSPTIYAPIAGTVGGLSLRVGSVISPTSSTSTNSQQIATILTSGNPLITVNLSEVDISKVKIGEPTTITLDAYQGKTYTGKVVSIDTVGTTTSGVTNYPVVIKLDTNAEGVFSNMSAQASIIIETKDNVLLVPSSSIHSQNGTTYVQVMKNGQTQNVNVETGSSSDTMTEITSGLAEGDTIVTSTITSTSTQTGSQQSPFSIFGGGARGGAAGGTVRVR